MYKRILVAIEHSSADRTIIEHVTRLAELTGAALLLVHVADGWAARNFDQLNLRESEEMKTDRAYLEELRGELEAALNQLPDEQRTAVVLCDVDGLDYNEIAVAMRTSIGTVKSRIARGRARLRLLLASKRELLAS